MDGNCPRQVFENSVPSLWCSVEDTVLGAHAGCWEQALQPQPGPVSGSVLCFLMHQEVRRPCLTLALPQTLPCELKLWVPINLSFATLCLSVFCTVMRKDTAAQESGLEETIPFSLSQRLEWESSNSYTLSADPDQSVVQVSLCRRLSLTRCTGHSGTNEGFFSFTFKKRFFL